MQNVVLFRGNPRFVLQHYNCDHFLILFYFFTGVESFKGKYKRAVDKMVTWRTIMTQTHTRNSLAFGWASQPHSLKEVTLSVEESHFLPAHACWFPENLKSLMSDDLCLNYNFTFAALFRGSLWWIPSQKNGHSLGKLKRINARMCNIWAVLMTNFKK